MGENPAKHLIFFSFQNNLYNENKARDFGVEKTNYIEASYDGLNVKNWCCQSGQKRPVCLALLGAWPAHGWSFRKVQGEGII